jgi:ankyrin repeat protein
MACSQSNMEIIRHLLAHGADPNLGDSADTLPLHICLAKYELRAAELLLKNGAQVDVLFSQNFKLSPLHVAMQKGSKKMAEMLLKYGAVVNIKNYNGETPLYLAVKLGVDEAIPQLLKAGADMNIRYKKNRTILHIACKYDREDCVQILLKAGIKVRKFVSPRNNTKKRIHVF